MFNSVVPRNTGIKETTIKMEIDSRPKPMKIPTPMAISCEVHCLKENKNNSMIRQIVEKSIRKYEVFDQKVAGNKNKKAISNITKVFVLYHVV